MIVSNLVTTSFTVTNLVNDKLVFFAVVAEDDRGEGAETLAPGSSLNFRYPTTKDSAILVRSLDGELHAFGQKCTHLSCPVYFERAHQRLECPCHDGAFDAKTGNVLYGPPPRPLDPIKLEVRADGEVWAVGREAGSRESLI